MKGHRQQKRVRQWRQLTTEELLDELCFSAFITDSKEAENVTAACRRVLKVQGKQSAHPAEHIDETLGFVHAIWEKYDCVEIAEIYSRFVKIEEALFGLERDEKEGKRYREHFVHMFNCYVFGLRIISRIFSELPAAEAKRILKIQDENLKAVGLPFGENYSYKKRAFYIWTLIATFHDIAIPFQHLSGMGKGITKFVEEFGWGFTNAGVIMKHYDAAQLRHYFNLLAGIFGGKLAMDKKGLKYRRPTMPHHYLAKILGREFDSGNHSVLSGYLMWKTIEEIFLVNRGSKYFTTMDEFNLYTEYVLEQDIARAALAISLHSIGTDTKSKQRPQMFPVRFEDFPLSFLLILSDELQEYLRWEGTTLKRGLRFSSHPCIEIEIDRETSPPKTSIVAAFSLDSANAGYIIDQAKKGCKFQKRDPNEIKHLSDAVTFIGSNIKETLEEKLVIGGCFRLRIEILKDWDQCLYVADLKTERPEKDCIK